MYNHSGPGTPERKRITEGAWSAERRRTNHEMEKLDVAHDRTRHFRAAYWFAGSRCNAGWAAYGLDIDDDSGRRRRMVGRPHRPADWYVQGGPPRGVVHALVGALILLFI